MGGGEGSACISNPVVARETSKAFFLYCCKAIGSVAGRASFVKPPHGTVSNLVGGVLGVQADRHGVSDGKGFG